MYTKKKCYISSAIVAIAALLLAYSIFNIAASHNSSIYSLFSSSRTVLVFCALFIAFAFVRAPESFFRFDAAAFICSFILATLIVINAPLNYLSAIGEEFYHPSFNLLLSSPGYYLAIFVFYLFFLYFFFLAIRIIFFSDALHKPGKKITDYIYIQLAVMLAAYICILWFLYQPHFPYRSSPDTQNQWDQIHGILPYNRIHAIGHTVFLRALLSIWDNFTIVIIFHFACIVLVYLLFSHYFCKMELRPVFVAAVFCCGLFFTCKFNTAYFFPWKDTPAAVCLALVCYFLIMQRQKGYISTVASFILGLSLAGCFLFRLNGIIALVVCGIYFSVSCLVKKHFRQLFAMLAAIAISISFINIYSEKVLKPVEYENGFSIQVFASGIAAMVDSGELTGEELAEIDEFISVKWMRDVYGHNIYKQALIWGTDNSPEIMSDKNLEVFNSQFVLDLGENKAEIVKLYLKLMPRHLGVCIMDILGSLYLAWGIPVSFLYSYPFVLLLLIYMGIKARLTLADCVVFLPSLCNTVSIMISTITNETRYLLPTFVLAPVYFLYIIMKYNEHNASTGERPNISN